MTLALSRCTISVVGTGCGCCCCLLCCRSEVPQCRAAAAAASEPHLCFHSFPHSRRQVRQSGTQSKHSIHPRCAVSVNPEARIFNSTGNPKPCCALLCRSIQPELYPRPDGTVYVCGEPAAVPVPAGGPAEVSLEKQALAVLEVRLTDQVSQAAFLHSAHSSLTLCSKLLLRSAWCSRVMLRAVCLCFSACVDGRQGVAGSLASSLSGAAVEAEQACYLPLSSDGLPVIGRYERWLCRA